MHQPIVVMGVSAAGKSAVAQALAQPLARTYLDADDLHPPANLAKMSRREPLNDADRAPWLDRVAQHLTHTPPPVAACSALRRAYRDRLRLGATPFFLWLKLSRDQALARSRARQDHFMPAELIDSQFATLEPLEPDEPGAAIDAQAPLDQVVQACLRALA